MRRNRLGQTELQVSEIMLGALTLGPLQANLPLLKAKKLILTALHKGINCIDTAETYRADQLIKAALDEYSGEVILGTKSPAVSYKEMEKSVIGALKGLGRDYLDIFYLHAAGAGLNVFEERAGALECLLNYRQKGYIRAVGISTHTVSVVRKAALLKEIEVIFPLINLTGMGIIGGTAEDMRRAISEAAGNGKGIAAMKALGGGNLLDRIKEALDYVRKIPEIHTTALGMRTIEELETNLRLFNNEDIPEEELSRLRSQKQIFISKMCTGCGACVKACPNNALSIAGGRAVADKQRCILCGYCNPVCKQFAIRLI